MTTRKRFRYNTQLDLDLMDQVVLVNPWDRNKSWEDVARAARTVQPLFTTVTTKSLMDRAKMLIMKRKENELGVGIETNYAIAVLSNIGCRSGIDCKEIPELIRTVDEAIVLWEAEIDAEKERKTAGKPITSLNADQINRICAPVIASIRCNDIPSPSTSDSSNTDCLKRKQTSDSKFDALLAVLDKLIRRDEDKHKRQMEWEREEREYRRAEAEEERRLRREELEVRRQELMLQAKREEAQQKRDAVILDFLLKHVKPNT